MEEEFYRLLEIFTEPQEVKEKKLSEIFQLSTEFFEKYKHIHATGTEEEKKKIQKKMDILRERFKEENDKTQAKIGITSQELKEISINPKHFTQEQWDFLQKAQASLDREIKEKTTLEAQKKAEREMVLREKKRQKSNSKKSGWLKS